MDNAAKLKEIVYSFSSHEESKYLEEFKNNEAIKCLSKLGKEYEKITENYRSVRRVAEDVHDNPNFHGSGIFNSYNQMTDFFDKLYDSVKDIDASPEIARIIVRSIIEFKGEKYCN